MLQVDLYTFETEVITPLSNIFSKITDGASREWYNMLKYYTKEQLINGVKWLKVNHVQASVRPAHLIEAIGTKPPSPIKDTGAAARYFEERRKEERILEAARKYAKEYITGLSDIAKRARAEGWTFSLQQNVEDTANMQACLVMGRPQDAGVSPNCQPLPYPKGVHTFTARHFNHARNHNTIEVTYTPDEIEYLSKKLKQRDAPIVEDDEEDSWKRLETNY